MTKPSPRVPRARLLRLAGLVSVMALAHWLGFALRLPNQELTTIWPAAGAALAILLSERRATWWGHLAWMFAVDVLSSIVHAGFTDPAYWNFIFSAVNTAEVATCALLLDRLKLLPLDCARTWSYASFAIVASFVVPTLFAVFGAMGQVQIEGMPFLSAWEKWWLGDALGILVFTPALLGLLSRHYPLVPRARLQAEAIAFLALYAAIGSLLLMQGTAQLPSLLQAAHLAVPFLVAAALRYSWRVVAWTLVIAAGLMVLEMHERPGAVALPTAIHDGDVQSVQLYLVAVGVPCMLLAAYVDGLRRTQQGLREEIAARKRSEQRRIELERQLLRAQQVEAVGNLASGVAHDLKNAFTVILGHLDLMEADGAEGPRASDSLRSVRQGADHASELCRSLLRIARRERVEPRPLELRALVRETAKLASGSLTPDMRLECKDLEGEPLWILGDESQMQQLVINLVINARDALDCSAGTISLSLEEQRVEGARAGLACLEVADTGSGMTEQEKERIFEPFFTTKKGSGTGLGLAVVHGIVRAHGGRITVESELGHGSRFTIRMPAISEPKPEGWVASQLRPGRGELLMLVSSTDDHLRETSRGLVRRGFQCLTLRRPSQLAHLLETGGGGVDLLILQSGDDDADAVAAVQRLRGSSLTIPVLLIAEHPAGSKALAADRMTRVVAPPSDLEALAALAREMIDAAGERRTSAADVSH